MEKMETLSTLVEKVLCLKRPKKETAQQAHDVNTTSPQHHDVASMLSQRCINVMCLLGVRSRGLKLDTHLDIGWMYCVYQNHNAAANSFLYFSIFLSAYFSLKISEAGYSQIL